MWIKENVAQWKSQRLKIRDKIVENGECGKSNEMCLMFVCNLEILCAMCTHVYLTLGIQGVDFTKRHASNFLWAVILATVIIHHLRVAQTIKNDKNDIANRQYIVSVQTLQHAYLSLHDKSGNHDKGCTLISTHTHTHTHITVSMVPHEFETKYFILVGSTFWSTEIFRNQPMGNYKLPLALNY